MELNQLLSIRYRLNDNLNQRQAGEITDCIENGRLYEQSRLESFAMKSSIRALSHGRSGRSPPFQTEAEFFNKLIMTEKATQLVNSSGDLCNPPYDSVNATSILKRLDATKAVIRQEKLRYNFHLPRSASEQRTTSTRISESAPTRRPSRAPSKPVVMHMRKTPSPSVSPDMTLTSSLTNTSIPESKNYEEATRDETNIIEVERRDPLKTTERRRAALAALKLKRSRS